MGWFHGLGQVVVFSSLLDQQRLFLGHTYPQQHHLDSANCMAGGFRLKGVIGYLVIKWLVSLVK